MEEMRNHKVSHKDCEAELGNYKKTKDIEGRRDLKKIFSYLNYNQLYFVFKEKNLISRKARLH